MSTTLNQIKLCFIFCKFYFHLIHADSAPIIYDLTTPLMVQWGESNLTCLKALAGAAWAPVSSRYFSQVKTLGGL